MKISELRTIISNENPCIEGYEWFKESAKRWRCKTAVEFFKKCKEAKYVRSKCFNPLTPYSYLVWIFGNCMDWTEVCGSENGYWYFRVQDTVKMKKFLMEHFGVYTLHEIPINNLCNALIRAFEDD